MSENWTKMTACDLGRGIESGQIDPVELATGVFSAIKSHPDQNRIYARLSEERAMSEAHAAKKRAHSKTRRSLLDGVPISWKDLFDTAQIGTESGAALLKGRVPARDAEVVENASHSGLVCLGKTHQTELAFSGLGVNPTTQTPPNSINPPLAPGGSSSGAAVSTALGLAAAGIGSDTGGSVRIPAAWNDLVGLKTTSGLLSLEGVVPLCATFDTVGPLCRSVEDANHLTAAMAGTAPHDLKNPNLKGKRLFVCESVALDDCDVEVLEAFETSVSALIEGGAIVERGPIAQIAKAMPLSSSLFAPEAYATWRTEIEMSPEAMFAPVLARFRAGADVSAVTYVQASQQLDALRKDYTSWMASYDAVLIPTSPILPPETAKLLADEDYFTERNLLALRNTRIGNLMGLCALTLPTNRAHCGLMMMGHPFGEASLLRLGSAAEAILRG